MHSLNEKCIKQYKKAYSIANPDVDLAVLTN